MAKGSYNNKVAFFAPSLAEGNKKITPVAMFVEVDSLPFQITDVEDYISHCVDHLRNHAAISEPSVVTLTSIAGNLAHNFIGALDICSLDVGLHMNRIAFNENIFVFLFSF